MVVPGANTMNDAASSSSSGALSDCNNLAQVIVSQETKISRPFA